MKRTFSGAPSGKGAVYEWDGDKNVGQGRMEITDTSVPSRIVIKLDFIRPFEGHNTATFTMEPAGGPTNVTWAMFGPNPFIGKIMHVFINMDRMVGTDFEVGLANLKAVAENGTRQVVVTQSEECTMRIDPYLLFKATARRPSSSTPRFSAERSKP